MTERLNLRYAQSLPSNMLAGTAEESFALLSDLLNRAEMIFEQWHALTGPEEKAAARQMHCEAFDALVACLKGF